MINQALNQQDIEAPNTWEAFRATLQEITGVEEPSDSANQQATFGFGQENIEAIASGHRGGFDTAHLTEAEKQTAERERKLKSAVQRIILDDYFDQILDDLNQQIAAVNQEIDVLKEQISEFDQQIETIDQQIIEYEEQVVELQVEVQELEIQVQEVEVQIVETEINISNQEAVVTVAEENLTEAEAERDEQQVVSDAANEAHENAGNFFSSSVTGVNAWWQDRVLENANEEVNERTTTLLEERDALAEFETELEGYQSEIENINDRLDAINQEIFDIENNKIPELETQRAEIEAQRAEIEAQITGLEAERAGLEAQFNNVLEQQQTHKARLQTDPEYAQDVANGAITLEQHIQNMPEEMQEVAYAKVHAVAQEGGEVYDNYLADPIGSTDSFIGKTIKSASNLISSAREMAGNAVVAVTDTVGGLVDDGMEMAGNAAETVSSTLSGAYDSTKNFFGKLVGRDEASNVATTVDNDGAITTPITPTNNFQSVATGEITQVAPENTIAANELTQTPQPIIVAPATM